MTDREIFHDEHMGTLSFEEISDLCWRILLAISGVPQRYFFTAVNHYTTDFCVELTYEEQRVNVVAEAFRHGGKSARYRVFKGTAGELVKFISEGYFSPRLTSAVVELEAIVHERAERGAEL